MTENNQKELYWWKQRKRVWEAGAFYTVPLLLIHFA